MIWEWFAMVRYDIVFIFHFTDTIKAALLFTLFFGTKNIIIHHFVVLPTYAPEQRPLIKLSNFYAKHMPHKVVPHHEYVNHLFGHRRRHQVTTRSQCSARTNAVLSLALSSQRKPLSSSYLCFARDDMHSTCARHVSRSTKKNMRIATNKHACRPQQLACAFSMSVCVCRLLCAWGNRNTLCSETPSTPSSSLKLAAHLDWCIEWRRRRLDECYETLLFEFK